MITGTQGRVSNWIWGVGVAVIAVAGTVGLPSAAEAGDKEVAAYSLTQGDKRMGTIRFFSYSSGKSGYAQIENDTTKKLVYRVKVKLGDGRTKTVRMEVDGGGKKSSSFFSAGTKNAGVKTIDIEYIRAPKR